MTADAAAALTHELAEPYSGRRILITGGVGFVGSVLARALVGAGADVTLLDSMLPDYGGNLANIAPIADRVTVNISDLRDEHSLRYLVPEQDVVFNLAGQTSHVDSMNDPVTDLEINCRAQLALLEACRRYNADARIVFAGTRQIYGRPQYLPVDEAHPIAPVDVNGVNKAAGEWYHLLYADVHGLRTSVLRMTNTYGPRMRVRDARQTFLGVWLRRLVEGRRFEVFGDGSQRRDFNYVDDAVRAFLLAGARDEAVGEVFNLGDDRVVSLLELAELLVELNGAGEYVVVPFPEERRAIDIGDYFGDYGKIRNALGWTPAIPLEEGLARSLAFYREHADLYWDGE